MSGWGRHSILIVSGGGSGSGCRKCGEDGHFARECPNKESSGGGGGGGCYKCGQDGHFARECPNSEGAQAIQYSGFPPSGKIGKK